MKTQIEVAQLWVMNRTKFNTKMQNLTKGKDLAECLGLFDLLSLTLARSQGPRCVCPSGPVGSLVCDRGQRTLLTPSLYLLGSS